MKALTTILHATDLKSIMPARRNRSLFLIDIAVPRDIDADVQQLDNVYLYNVDHLQTIVRENVRLREQELAHCREIIDEHAAALMARFAPAPEKGRCPILNSRPEWALEGAVACHS